MTRDDDPSALPTAVREPAPEAPRPDEASEGGDRVPVLVFALPVAMIVVMLAAIAISFVR